VTRWTDASISVFTSCAAAAPLRDRVLVVTTAKPAPAPPARALDRRVERGCSSERDAFDVPTMSATWRELGDLLHRLRDVAQRSRHGPRRHSPSRRPLPPTALGVLAVRCDLLHAGGGLSTTWSDPASASERRAARRHLAASCTMTSALEPTWFTI
jgi:hypothetical protein